MLLCGEMTIGVFQFHRNGGWFPVRFGMMFVRVRAFWSTRW